MLKEKRIQERWRHAAPPNVVASEVPGGENAANPRVCEERFVLLKAGDGSTLRVLWHQTQCLLSLISKNENGVKICHQETPSVSKQEYTYASLSSTSKYQMRQS